MPGSDADDRPDPEDDPFACSLCGTYLPGLDRVRGEDYCGSCRSEFGGERVVDRGRERAGSSQCSVEEGPPCR
jgi:hypothetical protein